MKKTIRDKDERILNLERIITINHEKYANLDELIRRNTELTEEILTKVSQDITANENNENINALPALKENLTDSTTSFQEIIKEQMIVEREEQQRELKKMISEVEREEKRKKNIIIKGIPESQAGKQEIEDLLSYITQDDIKILEMHRIGNFNYQKQKQKQERENNDKKEEKEQKNNDREGNSKTERIVSRPIRIKVQSVGKVDRIIENKKYLKRQEGWSTVFIERDLNWEERRKEAQKRWEKKEMRENVNTTFKGRRRT